MYTALRVASHVDYQLVCVQFYRDTMDVSEDVKSNTAAAAAAADTKTAVGTSLDHSGTDDVAPPTDANDVDMKTDEGWLL